MKNTLAIILALVMLFALCACGQQAASGSANQSVSQQGSAGSPKQDIADATPVEQTGELKHVKMGLSMQSLQAAAFHAWLTICSTDWTTKQHSAATRLSLSSPTQTTTLPNRPTTSVT